MGSRVEKFGGRSGAYGLSEREDITDITWPVIYGNSQKHSAERELIIVVWDMIEHGYENIRGGGQHKQMKSKAKRLFLSFSVTPVVFI